MRNRLLSILIGLAWFGGIYVTLKMMYIELDLHKASYLYLGTAIWMIFFMLFMQKIDRATKNWINFLVSTFYLFSILLALITFYSSPTEELDFLAGAIFFLSGSLALGASLFLKAEKNINKEIQKEKLGVLHKAFRYFLLLLFTLAFLFPLVTRIKSGSSHSQKMTKSEITEEILRVLPKYNKDLPMMLDEFTSLEKVSFEEMKFTYHYKLMDTNATVKTMESLKKDLNMIACKDNLTSMLIKNSIKIIYSYEFNNQDELVEIEVDSCAKVE